MAETIRRGLETPPSKVVRRRPARPPRKKLEGDEWRRDIESRLEALESEPVIDETGYRTLHSELDKMHYWILWLMNGSPDNETAPPGVPGIPPSPPPPAPIVTEWGPYRLRFDAARYQLAVDKKIGGNWIKIGAIGK